MKIVDPTHTPGPWIVSSNTEGGFDISAKMTQEPFTGTKGVLCQRSDWPDRVEMSLANADLISKAPDLRDQVDALLDGWKCERVSMYEDEGVEGWRWIEPDGTEHYEVGSWDELPPWPESAREALAR